MNPNANAVNILGIGIVLCGFGMAYQGMNPALLPLGIAVLFISLLMDTNSQKTN